MAIETILVRTGALAALLVLSGCFVEAEEEHAECANEERREAPCGTFGNGTQTEVCIAFRWTNEGFCKDDSECVVGATQPVGCGLNGRGSAPQRCQAGQWGEVGTCVDPDLCTDGTSDSGSCGILDAGTQTRACVRGQWQASGACDETYDCEENDVLRQDCGLNGRGTESLICVDNRWSAEYGPCDDPDVCEDGSIDQSTCPGEPGYNGDKVRERTCVLGQWANYGACFDLDACTDGAVENMACGDDLTGYTERICESGAWIGSDCHQTAKHVLGARDGVMVVVNAPNSPDHLLAWGDNRERTLAIPSTAEASVRYPTESEAPSPYATGTRIQLRFSASATHQCAIEGTDLYCWGSNEHGQLGVSSTTTSYSAQPRLITIPSSDTIGVNLAVSSVAVGRGFTCATTLDGQLYCWGRNDVAQLGGGVGPPRAVPGRLLPTEVVGGVAAGDSHACAYVSSSQKVFCWGDNTFHQAAEAADDVIDAPTFHESLSTYPSEIGATVGNGTIFEIVAGANHTLVVWYKNASSAGYVKRVILGVGSNNVGQLGHANANTAAVATVVEGRSIQASQREQTTVLAAGDTSCVFQYFNGDLRCTGSNAGGAIAPATIVALYALADASWDLDPDGEGIREVVLGANHVCVRLERTKRIRCRGANDRGQLGDGTMIGRASSAYVRHIEHEE